MSHFASSRSFLRQIDLSTLDLFVLTCETGSIAQAAERIKALEQRPPSPL